MEIIRAEHLTKTYGTGDTAVRALDDVSLSVRSGEFVAIIGSSGSGKSTLLHLMGGVDRPTSGTVLLNGQDVFSRSDEELAVFRRREVGLVYQFYNLVPVLDVVENLTLPVLLDGRPVNQDRLEAMIDTLGLRGREHHLPNQLSGGQQQRVALAGVLALDPELVVLDEATSMLDPQGAREVLSAVADARRERGCAVLLVTHDMDLAAHADSVAVMSAGRVLAQGAPAEVLRDRALLAGAGLEEPFAVQVWDALVGAGAACGEAPVTMEGLVGALCC